MRTRLTRKQVKSCAKFFSSVYSVQEYEHGFEVLCHKKDNNSSVFFWNDGKAVRTDNVGKIRKMGVAEGARVLGMLNIPPGP
jgi:hypothetical protein